MTLQYTMPGFAAWLLAGTALVAAGPALAQAPNARPQGGVVSAGSATIAQDAARTQVNQATDRAVIDWRGFDVGRDHAVRFQQPNSGSMTLNRVNSADPSRIAGQVTANGGIAIVNQSGVIFAPGARVEAQSVIVSTADIANQRFMAGGRMVFDRPGRADARIVNEGSITAREAGIAALVAPQVANRGVITARLGTVAIAGAETHVIDLHGDGLMSIEITGPVRQRPADGGALVANDGVLQADGGRVSLTAAAADGIVQNLVRAGGRVSANTDAATGRRGEVVVAGTGGAVIIEGQVEARGLAAGQRGGTVEVVADRVLAASGARIDASGTAGGGEIAFGQTRQGAAAPRRAERTGVAAGAVLRADATVLGQGGRVVLHSTDTTLMAGTLSARGGPQGGDGGFAEISGERGFRMLGAIDVSAPAGRNGSILFDPVTLEVVAEGTPGLLGNADVADGVLFGDAPSNALIAPSQIAAVTGDLTLQATTSITVSAAVTKPQGSLTLQTGPLGSIAINAPIAVDPRNLTLIAGAGGITQDAAAPVRAGTLMVQSGGDVMMRAEGNSILALGPSTVAGNFELVATTLKPGTPPELDLSGAITVGDTFDLTVRDANINQLAGSVVTAAWLNVAATGTNGNLIVLNGANQIATLGTATANAAIALTNAGSLTVAGPVSRVNTGIGGVIIRVENGDLIVTGSIDGNLGPAASGGGLVLTAAGNLAVAAGASVAGGGAEGTVLGAGVDANGVLIPGSQAGITLAGDIGSASTIALRAAGGGIRQTDGAITADSVLVVVSGGDAILDRGGRQGGTPNAVAGLRGTSAVGDFVLDNGITDLVVAGVLSAANIGLRTEGTLTLAPPGVLSVGDPGFLSAPGGRISLRIGDLAILEGIVPIAGPRIQGAMVEIAPATERAMLAALPDAAAAPPGAFALRLGTLGLIEATDTWRFGATTFGGATTATATSLDIASGFTFAGTLDLRSLGAIAQAAGSDLAVGALTGTAGGAVTLANAGNAIGFLDDFSAGGGFALTAGAITLRGLLSTPGQLAALTSTGGIQSTGGGRVEAGELRAVAQGGSISLTGANRLDRLGESSTPGDLALVNAGPQMTIPAGQTVQAAGTGSVTATAGSITVDGTIRAASLSLSAPAGTVAVNGFSAIAFAGGLALSGQAVAVNGLIAGSTGVTVTAAQSASFAGMAQAPSLAVTAPSIGFGGFDAAGSAVALILGSGGSASGALAAASLQVTDGLGAMLAGSIAGDATGTAAALGRRFAGGAQLGDPPPNRFDYLFNGCPIGASLCASPISPLVPSADGQPPLTLFPAYTIADNARGVVGELDPAGQPPANPLVQLPVLPLAAQPGRDTTEDRELAPPDIRTGDF